MQNSQLQIHSNTTRCHLRQLCVAAISLTACATINHTTCRDVTGRDPCGSKLASLIERNNKVKQVRSVISRYAPLRKTPGLAGLIVDRSTAAGFDPLFVAAIIKSESTFKIDAVSHKGAHGLMQVTPIAEREMRNRWEQPVRKQGNLATPKYNLDLGLSYLRHLENTFGGNKMIALVAYNCGPTRVLKALDGESKIPDESFRYAQTIMRDHQNWVSRS